MMFAFQSLLSALKPLPAERMSDTLKWILHESLYGKGFFDHKLSGLRFKGMTECVVFQLGSVHTDEV